MGLWPLRSAEFRREELLLVLVLVGLEEMGSPGSCCCRAGAIPCVVSMLAKRGWTGGCYGASALPARRSGQHRVRPHRDTATKGCDGNHAATLCQMSPHHRVPSPKRNRAERQSSTHWMYREGEHLRRAVRGPKRRRSVSSSAARSFLQAEHSGVRDMDWDRMGMEATLGLGSSQRGLELPLPLLASLPACPQRSPLLRHLLQSLLQPQRQLCALSQLLCGVKGRPELGARPGDTRVGLGFGAGWTDAPRCAAFLWDSSALSRRSPCTSSCSAVMLASSLAWGHRGIEMGHNLPLARYHPPRCPQSHPCVLGFASRYHTGKVSPRV